MIGTIFEKPVRDLDAYTAAARWCNANGAVIEDKGDFYEVCAAPEPEAPEPEDIAAEIAEIRQRLSALESLLEGDLR